MKCECDFAPNARVYKSNDLMHSVCLYLRNTINLHIDKWQKLARTEACVLQHAFLESKGTEMGLP